MTLVLVLAVFLATAGVALAAGEVLAGRRQLRASLQRAATVASEPVVSVAPVAPRRGRQVPWARELTAIALRLHPRTTTRDVALRLAGAGFARRISPDGYLAGQVLGACAAAAFGLVAGGAGGSAASALLWALVLAGAALYLPDLFLKVRTRSRRERIQAALPGALDLLSVSVEAGLGLDASMARVAETVDGPLAEEFSLTLSEIRVGEARDVALQRLADRIDTPELSAFVRSVVQADHLGVSLAQTLRTQASEARQRRQLAAEERAAKAPVRMLFPTVFLIFPALFVVVLGPPILSILQNL